MRIALLSTCAVAVPPRGYGGTELIIAELAKSFVRLGHEVTVYATGESTPEGKLRYRFERRVWPPDPLAELRHAAYAWNDIRAQDAPFDVVHAHQAPALALASMQRLPVVLTLHHRREPALNAYYGDFPGVSYVAISKRQAELSPEVNVSHVVHHGLDPDLYDAGSGDGGYAAFLGRLAPEKAPHLALDAAREAGVKLRIGGEPHWQNAEYFAKECKPRIDAAGDGVEWLGEVSHEPKVRLLKGARALLFPIVWEEPFGLVMIESMLVGTPVIAFARGSVPEVVEEGVTGFIVRSEQEMADRLKHVDQIDRVRCRARARERWSSLRMATDYLSIYEKLIEEKLIEKGRRSQSGRVRISRASASSFDVANDAERDETGT